MSTERSKLIEQIKEIKNQQYDFESYTPEYQLRKKELNRLYTQLKKNAPKITPGGTYTVEEFEDSIGLNSSKPDLPYLRFEKEVKNREQYIYRNGEPIYLSEKDLSNLQSIIGNKPGIYNYFCKKHSPFNIIITKIGEDREDVKSNNIYSLMAARTLTHYEGSFQIKISPIGEPITITNKFSKDTTLSLRDINSFM